MTDFKKAFPPKNIFKEEKEDNEILEEFKPLQKEFKASRGFLFLIITILIVLLTGTGMYTYIKFFREKELVSEFKETDIFEDEDEDNDGLTTKQELILGTNPEEFDTDEDDISDGWEVENNLDPLNYYDAVFDGDEDGLTNIQEYKYKTNPNKPDTDGDGFEDGLEVKRGHNPVGSGELKIKPEKTEINIVSIKGNAFNPAELKIKERQTVIWINEDIVEHTVTGILFNSQVIRPGQSWQYVFKEIGTFNYFCSLHPQEQGKVIVE